MMLKHKELQQKITRTLAVQDHAPTHVNKEKGHSEQLQISQEKWVGGGGFGAI